MRWLREHRLEVKYALIAGLLVGAVLWAQQSGLLARAADSLGPAVEAIAGLGVVGAFLLGLLGNSSILLQVPYTVPMLSAAIGGAPLAYLLAVAVAAAIGATVGELVSYTIADHILRRSRDLSEGRLFRWVERTVRTHPRSIPWLVFTWAVTLLPDDTVLIPLAMIRYGAARLLLPLALGKLGYCVGSAVLFHLAGARAAALLPQGVTTDLAVLGLIGFLLVIFYQAERARASRRGHEHHPVS